MTVFLMVAEDTGQILPTILSRTQLIRVPRMRDEDLLEALKKTYGENEEILLNTVHLAEGSYSKAVEILAMSEESEFQLDLFIRIMRLSYSRKFQDMFDWVDEVSGLGRERQKSFLAYALRMVRENFLLNMQQKELVRMSLPENDFSSRFSDFINEGNAPTIIQELENASLHIEANAYARIVFLDFALTLIKLIR